MKIKLMWVTICGKLLTIVSRLNDKTVWRCNIESKGTIRRTVRRQVNLVSCDAVDGDRKRIVSGSTEKTMVQWDSKQMWAKQCSVIQR